MKVYLGGPIEGVSEEKRTSWRKLATNFFELFGVETLDPTRRASFHSQKFSKKLASKIVSSDLTDIFVSDYVLINLKDRGSGKAWGSLCELTYAHLIGKIVIVVLEKEFKHPFVEKFATKVVDNVDVALFEIMKLVSHART